MFYFILCLMLYFFLNGWVEDSYWKFIVICLLLFCNIIVNKLFIENIMLVYLDLF